jgi:sugar lactone lactonase YvrE
MPFASGLVFGEGLRWYGGRLWLADMLGRAVYAYTASGARETMAVVPPRPNGLGFLPDGRAVITSMADQRLLVREHDGRLAEHARLDHLMTGYCGDMAVDAHGRVYLDDVGFRVFAGEPRKPGRLLRVDPDGTARILLEGLAFPNGMWITRDGKRLIFAEGRGKTLFSFDLAADGSFASQRVFAKLPNDVLDGLTLDVEDGVWQCCPHDQEIVRVLDGGEITHRIAFPLKPVACCLGGPGLRTLYVVAADYTLERMARDDSRAEIFTVEVEVPGFLLPGDTSAGASHA